MHNYDEPAGLALPAHPHMLRHACGCALADQGVDTRLIQDYIGHRNIQQTVSYTGHVLIAEISWIKYKILI